MQEFTTPMMKQYQAIKREYPDCLLFFRLGDFYELFLEDAHIGASVLNITLTGRPKGRDGRIPMAGVPYHAVDSYLAKLVKAGYKVAICEQMSEANKKGIVERAVVRIVTPGTMLDERALDQKSHNFLISLTKSHDGFACAVCDVSTGYFEFFSDTSDEWQQVLTRELTRILPIECILSEIDYEDRELMQLLNKQSQLNIFSFHTWEKEAKKASLIIKTHFNVDTLIAFSIDELSSECVAVGNLLAYLKHTQKDTISHIRIMNAPSDRRYMSLDHATLTNLELFSTIREHDTRGSLLSVLDNTLTSMGGRELKEIMKLPLIVHEDIVQRHEAVGEIVTTPPLRKKMHAQLSDITDIERILARLATGLGNARDMKTLEAALDHVISIKHLLIDVKSTLLNSLQQDISPELHHVISMLQKTIVSDPPVSITEGGMIQEGIDEMRDDLAKIVQSGKDWVISLEEVERKRSGINSLKVRYNKVFGFYIEISKANTHLVPDYYIRKQTLVNGERYTTEELANKESQILNADIALKKREQQLYDKTLTKILTHIQSIQSAAHAVALIDCIHSFATLAISNRYCSPKMVYSGEIRIVDGRHPVVETLLNDHQFVPNSCTLTNVHTPLLLVTGPNMAGKSVFIRQVALSVYLAHIGSWVPAKSARIGVVDNIFVRSGASDVITSGLSTFMVEMVETAYILRHATGKSLIIMDEIGRGTSTYDGISIAWAVAQYLVTHFKVSPKTLFATHYHELQRLEESFPNKIKNVHMGVHMNKQVPVMLYTLQDGPATESFGIAVAQRAGVPKEVISKAKKMLEGFGKDHGVSVVKQLQEINIDSLTPIDALTKLSELQKTSHGIN